MEKPAQKSNCDAALDKMQEAKDNHESANKSENDDEKMELDCKTTSETKMDLEANKANNCNAEASCVESQTKSKDGPSTESAELHSASDAPQQIEAIDECQEKIPENILSPPKSETTQTDESNTNSSSSPASDSQMSPLNSNEISQSAAVAALTSLDATKATANKSLGKTQAVSQAINVVANGSIPKSTGKPMRMSDMNKKISKPRQRKPKAKIAMYESEISDNKIGIKLCIKKSDTGHSSGTGGGSSTTPKSNSRKRSRAAKTRPRLDSDDSDYATKRKTSFSSTSNTQKKVSFDSAANIDNKEPKEPVEQTPWGCLLPEPVLLKIFEYAVDREGCLPTLCRLGRVCSLWRTVSLTPKLWRSIDLSMYIKDKFRNEYKLKWFIDNRCKGCTDLNVSNWKVSDINCFLSKLAVGAPNLNGITLAGWKSFTSDHLTFLVDNLHKLGRLDLSSVNTEMSSIKSAVGINSLCYALKAMGGRLTHLYLAHNRLGGIPQIVTTLASYCPNILLLDLSNVTTVASSHGVLHIEKLQNSCPKLRVLRVTNSQITIAPATLQETMDSPGFPDLEELSLAVLTAESRSFGDDHLQRILKESSKLKLLDVRGCVRLTHESLIRLPAWDIKHLFLSGCAVTRDSGSGLELICSKWAHSLTELDLAWCNMQPSLDNALHILVEKGSECPLAHLNLCGSSVSEDTVRAILGSCPQMSSINLSSCRGLPRGVKREIKGEQALQELREVLKVKIKFKLPSESSKTTETSETPMECDATNRDSGDGGGGGRGRDGTTASNNH